MTDTIDREYIEMKRREARSEIDAAIEDSDVEKARYWLGRRRALDNILEELDE